MGQVIPFKRRGLVSNEKAASNVARRPVAAFYSDRDGQFDFVNGDWCRLAQCGQLQAFGDGWLDSIDPEDRILVTQSWRDAVRNEKFFSIEFRLALARHRVVVLQALPQYDGDGDFAGHSGTLTEREPMRGNCSETAAQVERLRLTIDMAGLNYFEHDLVAGATYRSKPLRELFGGNRNVEELRAAIHPEDSRAFWETHDRCRTDRTLWKTEFRVKFPGCETLDVRSQGLFSYDRAGNAVSLSGFTMAVSDWNANSSFSAADVLEKFVKLPD